MNHWQLRDAGGDSPDSAAAEWSTNSSSNGFPDNYGVAPAGRASAAAGGFQQAGTVGLMSTGFPTSLQGSNRVNIAHDDQGAAGRWYSGGVGGNHDQYDEMGWYYSGDVYIPAITCQVEGCGKDLMRGGNIKHYYKRHRICEVHAKASAILVDGAAQRFCQQCGRFQLISEFDEDKRSCRSRLADHNRRRRKSTSSAADQPTSSQNTGNSPADLSHDSSKQTSSSSMEINHYKR